MNELERLIAEEVATEQRHAAARPHGIEPRALELCSDFVALMRQDGRAPIPLFEQDTSHRVERLRFKGSHGRQHVGISTTRYHRIDDFWPMWQDNLGGMTGVQIRDGVAIPIMTSERKFEEDREFVRQLNVSPKKATSDDPAWRSYHTIYDAVAETEINHRGKIQILAQIGAWLTDSSVTRAVRHLRSTGEVYVEPNNY